MIGTQLEKYEVLQKIGEGGMATVYRGRHATLGRDVAIKVLHPHLSASTRNRKRFAREARAIEHLRHDNILEIYDYSGVESADCYIVTEFVEGGTLSELLARVGAIPSEIAAIIGLQLADALAYAHQQGILHRDLKPDNVMLRTDGRVKLMDFGIARFLDESQVTMTGALVGSPAFMSPEQAREEELDPRSDLFSLGTLLYFTVSGHLPFQGSNPSITLRNIIEGNRAPLVDVVPAVSATFADAVERLLARHRDDRFVDARAAGAALRESLAEVGVDPADPRWSLRRYLDDPDAVVADLEAFLRLHLLDAGRARLEQGDALAGLRLLNRLLTLAPDNAEAMSLLNDLHGVDASPDRRWWLAGIATAALTAAVLGAWSLPRAPSEAPSPPTSPEVVAGAPTPSAPPVPDLEPPATADAAGATEPAGAPVSPPADVDVVTPTDAPEPVASARPAAPEAATLGATAAPARSPPPPALRAAPEAQRPAPPDADAPSPPQEPAPACVAFRSLTAPADVLLDGARIGTTRDPGCHPLPPGTHTFVLRGPMVEEKTVRLTLAPGEVRDAEVVELVLRPGRVRFGSSLPGTCVVTVDGTPRGTLAALDHVLPLERPDQRHVVRLKCGGRTFEETYDGLAYPEVWFSEGGP